MCVCVGGGESFDEHGQHLIGMHNKRTVLQASPWFQKEAASSKLNSVPAMGAPKAAMLES